MPPRVEIAKLPKIESKACNISLRTVFLLWTAFTIFVFLFTTWTHIPLGFIATLQKIPSKTAEEDFQAKAAQERTRAWVLQKIQAMESEETTWTLQKLQTTAAEEAASCPRTGSMSECWLEACKHHLCSPHQRPADFYLCDLAVREWKISFLNGYFPVADSNTSVPNLPHEPDTTGAGHKGWAGSIRRGLRDLNMTEGTWNVNPSHMRHLGDVVWVEGCEAARKILHERSFFERRRGFLLCGPIGLDFMSKDDLTDDNVGFFVVPSTWVVDGVRGKGSLNYNESARIRVLVSGVDVNYWKPEPEDIVARVRTKSVVLFVKNFREEKVIETTSRILKQDGWKIVKITYGDYSSDTFRDALRHATASVFFTHTESQSIALTEAWAMDVPTLVYDANPQHPPFYFGRWWLQATEAPYLNNFNGFRWSDPSLVVNHINLMHQDRTSYPFEPRRYVMSTMTDAISVWNVLRAVQCEWTRRYRGNVSEKADKPFFEERLL
jgi:hypothetical protein